MEALKPYLVSFHKTPGDRFIMYFDCMAEDADHAIEQTEDACPGCDVRIAMIQAVSVPVAREP